MNWKKDNKTDNKSEQEQQTPIETEKSIMPTMLDAEELDDKNTKRDLSSIIPSFEEPTNGQETIISKESELKTDGSTVIGVIQDDNYNALPEAQLPDAIDIAERKTEALRNKNKKKKNPSSSKKTTSKAQGITAIIALIIIAGLVGFVFYYKNRPQDTDFKVLNINIELGSKLPLRTSEYVKPAKGKDVDELAYVIDTSNVKVDEVGVYEFTVTYQNVSKKGKITIEDTTGPEFETQEVTIMAGKSIEASQFIKPSSCHDPSGCNYRFEEEGTSDRYTTTGVYTVYVVAYDAYNNSTLKSATLTVIDIIKYHKKTTSNSNYTETDDYELHYSDFYNQSILLNGIYTQNRTYTNTAEYQKDKEKYYGELGYTFDDEKYTMKSIQHITSVGLNYTKQSDIEYYLNSESFTEYNK